MAAQVGDKIRVINAAFAGNKYQNDDILVVTKTEIGSIMAETVTGESVGVLWNSEYEVIPAEAETLLKKGDKIKVIRAEDNEKYQNGDILTVTSVKFSPAGVYGKHENGHTYFLYRSEFERYTGPEFPREISYEEIQAGDTIRYEYTLADILAVREGEVGTIGETVIRSSGDNVLAFSPDYSSVRVNVKYTLLDRPAPKPKVHVVDTLKPGSMTKIRLGRGYLHVLGAEGWTEVSLTDFHLGSALQVVKTERVKELFDNYDGQVIVGITE